MDRTVGFLLCAVLSIISPLRCSHAGSSSPEKPQKKALFVLGDSLFDAGINQYLNNSKRVVSSYFPYGETYFGHPTGRVCDGRIVPDFIAQFAKKPLIPPYLQPGPKRLTDGINFASAGSGVLLQNDTSMLDLPLQMNYFKEAVKSLKKQVGDREAKNVLKNAVYLISAGGNDYAAFYSNNPNATQSSQAQFVKTVISSLTNALKEIYRIGGRKFAFQNVAPLGCTPISRATYPQPKGGCVEVLSGFGRQHNKALSPALQNLESTLPGFKYSLFHYYTALSDLINNPSKNGNKESKVASCGSGAFRSSGCAGGLSGTQTFQLCSDPAEYLWFDEAHTAESSNFKLAQLMWGGPPTIIGPCTVKQLFEI